MNENERYGKMDRKNQLYIYTGDDDDDDDYDVPVTTKYTHEPISLRIQTLMLLLAVTGFCTITFFTWQISNKSRF